MLLYLSLVLEEFIFHIGKSAISVNEKVAWFYSVGKDENILLSWFKRHAEQYMPMKKKGRAKSLSIIVYKSRI